MDREIGKGPLEDEGPEELSCAEELRDELFSALDSSATVPLLQARLTDRRCVAVLLQGAVVLAHCEERGMCLPEGWHGARVSARGLLWLPEIVPGRAADFHQLTLLDLLGQLFRSTGAPAGRGEAKRSARRIEAQLRQQLTPVPADRTVHEIFDRAPFLWGPAFAAARRSLMARRGKAGPPSVIGPGAARRRLLRAAGGCPEKLAALLESPAARDLWEGYEEIVAPELLAARGRWGQALASWRRQESLDSEAALGMARSAMALGRHRQALEVLAGRRGAVARLLRGRCQLRLGKLNAALSSLRGLEKSKLDDDQHLEQAELSSRVLAALGRREAIAPRVEAALRSVSGPEHGLALVRAGAAWDRGDLEAADRELETARPGALADPRWTGRWHHLTGQRALLVGDGLRAAEHVARALRLERRQLTPFRAARRWSDLAMARVFNGDLAGAERACRHAERLLWGSEGPVRTTLVLYNLAEVRLRRGRLAGVETVLEQSTAENRRSGNRKALIRDLELWVRLELAQGRCEEALIRCAEARRELDEGDPESRAGVFELLAARAQGWLGRPNRAAACLDRVRCEDLLELEAEERPAVYALAGRFDEAMAEAASSPWSALWSTLAAGVAPEPRTWQELDRLEPYRAARLVYDCEILRPGVAPPGRVRWAVTVFRELAMSRLAEGLEGRSLGPWRALEAYGSARRDPAAAAELLRGAGYHEARLSWLPDGIDSGRGGDETVGREIVMIDGDGGEEELVAQGLSGRLVLTAPRIDGVLKALFGILRADLEPPRKARDEVRRQGVSRGGILGESQVMVAVIDRLERLARSDLPLLLLGESGTGKELFARQAHRLSRRSGEPFNPVNCAALSESLIQSELFGHVRGAFTGADRDRQGIFESTRGGTVFLDEIGDLPLTIQGKLLRVLQEQEVRRLGESHARKVDVRVVTATHRDLARMVEDGEFRGDLFYRLKVATIELPPLRERERDILTIAEELLDKERRHRPEIHLSPEAAASLMAHVWPGNVRELVSVLKLGIALSEDGRIEPRHLELPDRPQESTGAYQQLVDQYRKKLIQEAMDQSGGNQAEAARRLDLSRQALSYLVRKFDLV